MIDINLNRSILVCIYNAKEPLLKEILAGIEEEGIPFEIKKIGKSDMLKSVYTAAKQSTIGIALGVVNNNLILHYNKLKEEDPIYNFKLHPQDKEKARIIGCNAARLYKVMPLKKLSSQRENLEAKVRGAVIAVLSNTKVM